MTGFLASVTSAAEAEIVLAAGADIIDLKDPHSGALGALPSPVTREAVRAVADFEAAFLRNLPGGPRKT